MQRAYSILHIKSIDEAQRVLHGIASTPETDRQGDIVEPKGAEFTLPIPFLWQHDTDSPIGHVVHASVTKAGIEVRVQLEQDDEPGPLKDLLDKAWRSIRKGLVRGLSIGFRPIGDPEPIKGTWGLHYTKWDWLELSAVTIPANAGASIQTVKSFDVGAPAATGTAAPTLPAPAAGAVKSLTSPKPGRGTMSTITEQVKDYEATRAAKSARMETLMSEAADAGVTLDEAQSEEYDGLEAEVAQVDKHLVRLRKQERMNVEKAKVVAAAGTEAASDARGVSVIRAGRHNLPKGTGFTRYAMAIAAAKGNASDALMFAERWKETTPEVAELIRSRNFMRQKAEPGTSTDDVYGWAGPLVYPQNLVSEFVDLLRPATILGKLTGIRSVPFNTRIPVQIGGSTVNWVGEAAPKPVTDLAFDTISLGFHKVAGIIVLTEELVRLSTPSAEEAVRRDLVEQTVRFIDTQFIDPNVTASANNPASITQGVGATAATGTDAEALYADINAALATFDDTDMGTGNLYILMRNAQARGISALRNALGQFEFTGLSAAGGTLAGFPVIVSNSVPSGTIVFVKADEVLLADDGSVALDASKEATLDMAGGESPNFSLWQKNCIGIRAERGITWAKRRPDAVALITGADYGPVSGS